MTQSARWTQRWWLELVATVGLAVITVTACAPTGNTPQDKAPDNEPPPPVASKSTTPQQAPTDKPQQSQTPTTGKPEETAGKPQQSQTPTTGKPLQSPTGKIPAEKPAPKFDGWYLYQTSGVFGDQDVNISKNGIRIVDRKSGLTVVSKAPKWDVITIHPKAKTYCTSAPANYIGMTPADVLTRCGAGTAKIPFTKEARAEVAGMDVASFITPKTYEKQQEKAFNNESAGPYFIRNARFLVADKVTVPSQAAKILAQHYDVPAPAAGVPVDMKYFDLKGNLHIVLVTSSIENKAIDTGLFTVDTKGMKLLKTSRDVQKSGMTPMKQLPNEFVVKDILVKPNKKLDQTQPPQK